MTTSELLNRFEPGLRETLRPFLRTAYVPSLEPGEATGPVTKLGGVPWLPEGVEWPTCPNCKQAMQLIVQLDLSTLPEGAPARGEGLAQLFYCNSTTPLCEVDCEAFFPFAKSVVARVVRPDAPGADAAPRALPNPLTPRLIVGWKPEEDLPNREELSLMPDVELDDESYDELHEAKRPLAGVKLWGWPHWVQGVEYPACPICREPMRLLLQIDSDEDVGMQWGDLGCAHWCQCAKHPEQMAFGWACG